MSERHTATLWIKGKTLRDVLEGRKTVVVRNGSEAIVALRPEDTVRINNEHPYVIERITYYNNVEEMLLFEDYAQIMPGSSEFEAAYDLEQALVVHLGERSPSFLGSGLVMDCKRP